MQQPVQRRVVVRCVACSFLVSVSLSRGAWGGLAARGKGRSGDGRGKWTRAVWLTLATRPAERSGHVTTRVCRACHIHQHSLSCPPYLPIASCLPHRPTANGPELKLWVHLHLYAFHASFPEGP
jgi:hypothetical protein